MPPESNPDAKPTGENKPATVALPSNVITVDKLLGYGKFAFAVVPVLFWFVKLEVGNTQRDMLIERQSEQIVELRADLKDAESIEDEVRANSLKLAVLEGKLDTANGRLGEILNLLGSGPP